MTMREKEAIATMSSNFTYEEAAPITEGGHYALCDIRAAKIKSGQNILINGATGAIGSAAVQLVKSLFGGKKVIFHLPSISKDDVILLKDLVETGQKIGNVVIIMT